MPKRITRTAKILFGMVIIILVAVGLYFLPPIHEKLAWRLDNLRLRIIYFFNPPENVVFIPGEQSQYTLTPGLPTSTPTPTSISTSQATPTITSTPVPQALTLDGVTFVDQMNRWNYCGPANLTMALKYLGWTGTRDDVGAVVKPGVNDPSLTFIERSNTDVNVMPYEMVDFVNEHTSYRARFFYGGDLDLIKQLIAARFPLIVEKGTYQHSNITNKIEWVGHYAFTTGYDNARQVFVYQDSYTPDANIPKEQQGFNVTVSYADYINGWRAFNYVFIVVYSPERETELFKILGPWLDDSWAAEHALEIAKQETQTLTESALFFAWFNKGTSFGLLTDYGNAALAYDYAYTTIYPNLPESPPRPFRILWYQTGPYKAYYYTSRNQDVVNLADATIQTINSPRTLEESLYWRARAEYALGETEAAVTDMLQAVHYHPGFQPALDMLALWGIAP